jgi:hypothetical protein
MYQSGSAVWLTWVLREEALRGILKAKAGCWPLQVTFVLLMLRAAIRVDRKAAGKPLHC